MDSIVLSSLKLDPYIFISNLTQSFIEYQSFGIKTPASNDSHATFEDRNLQSLSRSAWQSWESVTIIPCLTKNRLSIHLLHRQACLNNQSIYIDPESGLQVLTRYAHLQRGKCCGNQCRHCPYGHINAEINFSRPQKIFNTSYYE
ncbi:unnamed protein product [Rotaria sp. Silwood1]|nr:unnamed protein product [Rotaria sp. Silwood1]